MNSAWTMTLVSVLGLGVLGACRNTPESEELPHRPGDPSVPEMLDFEEVSSGVQSGIAQHRVVLCRSESDFDTLWSKHSNLEIPRPAPPAIDFTDSMVLAVFAGQRSSAGYAVEVESIEVLAGRAGDDGERGEPRLLVTIAETEPDPDAMTASVMTSPFQLVRLSSVPGEIVPTWRTTD